MTKPTKRQIRSAWSKFFFAVTKSIQASKDLEKARAHLEKLVEMKREEAAT